MRALAVGVLVSFALGSLATAAETTPKASGTGIVSVEIPEPARVSLADLVRRADVVALVSVDSGDAEHYVDVVYKATVIRAFKGVKDSQVVYFGPFRTYGVGSEYVIALRWTGQRLGDLVTKVADSSLAPYDSTSPYLRIMYEGYSVMPVDYTCALPSCDYAIDVSYSQVTLPANLKLVPNPGHGGASEHGWVRKTEFLSELSRLTSGKQE